MDQEILDSQVDNLVSKIKHYLVTTMGVTLDEACDEQLYKAFVLTLREEIMIHWSATLATMNHKHVRIAYYLCMEYMPGKLLASHITNMQIRELVERVVKKLERTFTYFDRIETDPGLGNGGLGRLAACLLESLATRQYPVMAYGLRYQYGIFEQILCAGHQVEKPEMWLLHENPWEFRRDAFAESVRFSGRVTPSLNQKGSEIFPLTDCEEVRAIPYDLPMVGYHPEKKFNVVTLRLWTTKESPRNFEMQRFNAGLIDQAGENTVLTDVLYPNDNNEVGKRIRLKQEFLLASASIQNMIRNHLARFPDMTSFADKVRIQINDTHPSIAVVELFRILIETYQFTTESAWEVVQTCFSYTNHTILKESLEEWNQTRLQKLLPAHYQLIERINRDLCDTVRRKFSGDEEKAREVSILEGGQVRMAHLAVHASHRVNGVSPLHTEIIKKSLFKALCESAPDKIVNVTNGVTQRRFLLQANRELALFITKRIGDGWIYDFSQICKIAPFADDRASLKEILEVKRSAKRALAAYLAEFNPIRDREGKAVSRCALLEERALYSVQIKRIHEYKRQLMNLLHIFMVYEEIRANRRESPVKRVFILAGKAAPGYDVAKKILLLAFMLARKIQSDPHANEQLQLVFVENYNVSRAEKIIPAADLSEQISMAGTEASGTGNMKLAMNGALTIATEDGANIDLRKSIGDSWWPFRFGFTAEENEKNHYNPNEIYQKEESIRHVLDLLKDGFLSENQEEQEVCQFFYKILLEGENRDKYRVLGDLKSYAETQKKVERLFLQEEVWAQHMIHNIAGTAPFSSDEMARQYAEQIWSLKPCPVDASELARVRSEYEEHDRCRIFKIEQ